MQYDIVRVVNVNNEERWKSKMIYCCEEHVELGLDIIVDEYETFPVLTKIDVDNLSTSCEFCSNRAVYFVANKWFHTRCG